MPDDEPTFPCRNCGRKFIKSSLEKHEPVCKKLSNLSRKPFDSGKQRANGSDVSYADIKKAQKEKEKNGGVYPRPHTNWKERHEHFIDAVSSSKKVDYALKTGAPLPPPPKTAVPSDYVQCEFCGRNFSEKAAERHVPFCRDQSKKSGLKPIQTGKSTTSQRTLPSKNEVRRDTDSRGRLQSRNDVTERRKSVDSRLVQSRESPTRNTSQSAGLRQNANLPPPSRRSNSATRNIPTASSNISKLKAPLPPSWTDDDRIRTSSRRDEWDGKRDDSRSRRSTSKSRRN